MKTKKPSKVDLVLALDGRSQHYQVELTPEETKDFLSRAEVYNRIPESISSFVDQIDAITPRAYFNPDNPNNGNPLFIFRVGNEGSRVIYLEVRAIFGLPKDFDWDDYKTKLAEIGRKYNADEIDIIDDAHPARLTMRFWWD